MIRIQLTMQKEIVNSECKMQVVFLKGKIKQCSYSLQCIVWRSYKSMTIFGLYFEVVRVHAPATFSIKVQT